VPGGFPRQPLVIGPPAVISPVTTSTLTGGIGRWAIDDDGPGLGEVQTRRKVRTPLLAVARRRRRLPRRRELVHLRPLDQL
jgi:hypothetical protein